MHSRQWKAIWTDQDGAQHEYMFSAGESRVLASIDFRVKMLKQGIPVPEVFSLEMLEEKRA